MVRYFINYEDFIEENKINKNITLNSPELFIIKKHKKNYYKFEPILYFIGEKGDLLNYARTLNYNKKGVLMVELTKEEANKFDELLIKKYEFVSENIYTKVFERKDELVNLIGFKNLINMNKKELSNGNIVAMMPCVSNKKYMYISADRGALSRDNNINKRRFELLKQNIGCDIYFHTNDEDILDKYKNEITKVKEIDFHTYDLIEHKVFVLDSIGNNELRNFNSNNFYCLDILSEDSIPVYISNKDNGYELDINKNDYNKKGYIINSIYFEKLLNSDAIEPLIKYINVYELNGNIYNKTSLENYIGNKKVLKYTNRSKW